MMMDSPLRTHTWQASSWFTKHEWGSGTRPSCPLEKHLSSLDVCHPPPPGLTGGEKAEPGSGAATLSTAVFYSPCLQVDRLQIVRDQGLVQKERCGNSHSDDGWGPRRDRCLAPSRLCSAALPQRCRALRTLPRWRRRRGGGVGDASQPIAAPEKPYTCVESSLCGERGCVLQVNPGPGPDMSPVCCETYFIARLPGDTLDTLDTPTLWGLFN